MHRLTVVLAALALSLGAVAPASAQPVELAEGWACVLWSNGGDAVALDGYPAPVRLASIAAPAASSAAGREAKAALQRVVDDAGCWVYVEPGTPTWESGISQYRAYLWEFDAAHDGWWLIQTELVSQGFARVDYHGHEPDAYAAALITAQQAAQLEQRGLWAGAG